MSWVRAGFSQRSRSYDDRGRPSAAGAALRWRGWSAPGRFALHLIGFEVAFATKLKASEGNPCAYITRRRLITPPRKGSIQRGPPQFTAPDPRPLSRGLCQNPVHLA